MWSNNQTECHTGGIGRSFGDKVYFTRSIPGGKWVPKHLLAPVSAKARATVCVCSGRTVPPGPPCPSHPKRQRSPPGCQVTVPPQSWGEATTVTRGGERVYGGQLPVGPDPDPLDPRTLCLRGGAILQELFQRASLSDTARRLPLRVRSRFCQNALFRSRVANGERKCPTLLCLQNARDSVRN